jgi:hypothetical protein
MKRKKQKLPRGWTEAKIQGVITHYENQTEEEAVAEDEAAFKAEAKPSWLCPRNSFPRSGN